MKLSQPSPNVLGLQSYFRQGITIPLGSINEIAISNLPLKWRLVKATFHDPSTTLLLSAAIIGIFTASGGSGTNLITAPVVAGLTGLTNYVDSVLTTLVNYRTESNIYVRVTTPNVGAATVNVTLFFDILY